MLVQQEAGVSYNLRSTEAIPHSTAFVVLCRHLDGIIFTSLATYHASTLPESAKDRTYFVLYTIFILGSFLIG